MNLGCVHSQDSSHYQPIVDGDRRIYRSRRRQLQLAFGMVAFFLATASLIFTPDPENGKLLTPSDYLPVVIPGAILVVWLVWKAMKAHVATDTGGIDLVRTVGHEYIPWSSVRSLEVHPTPGRQGFAVVVRRKDQVLLAVRNEINARPLRDRPEARRLARAKADLFHDQLQADWESRTEPEALGGPATSGVAAAS